MKSSTKCTNNHDIALACLFQWWRLMTKSPQAIIQKWSPCNTIVLITFFLPKKQIFFSYQAGFKHITSIKSGKSCLPRGMRIHTPLKLHQDAWTDPVGYPGMAQHTLRKRSRPIYHLVQKTSTARSAARLLRSTQRYVPSTARNAGSEGRVGDPELPPIAGHRQNQSASCQWGSSARPL